MSSNPPPSGIAPDHPLIFVHIPKTGGMSLFTALAEHFGTAIADLYDISPRNADAALGLLADRSKAVYCGHYSFGMHQWLDRPASYAAVVREPVSRLVSLYYYCQPMFETYRKRLAKAKGSMDSLWRDPTTSDFYLDFEPVLRGETSPQAFFASPSAELDNGMVRRFSGWGLNPQPCPAGALEAAKENVDRHFSVVGVLERYPETLELMARVFGLPSLRENKVNANKPRPESDVGLPEDVMEGIRTTNALDIAFYDWICARFDEILARPARLVSVAGGARRDPAGIPLWRSVGTSPLRDIAMQNRGSADLPAREVQYGQMGRVAHSRRNVQLETVLAIPPAAAQGAAKGAPGPRKFEKYRILFAPQQAKAVLAALQAAVRSYEKHNGPIEG